MSIIASTTEPSMALVVGMGLGIVFFGLICIIILCYLMSAVIRALKGNGDAKASEVKSAPVAAAAPAQTPIENRQELIAAVSAVIAEELGTDVSAIRIKSIKKI